MVGKPEYLKESPSQTAGPYVHIGCTPGFSGLDGRNDDLGSVMKTGTVKGTEITIRGTVFDGAGAPLKDAVIEIWQADAAGLYNSPVERRGKADPNFTGWGRCAGDLETGEFVFETVKPGRVPFNDGRLQAPHILFWIIARGINVGLLTRMYFNEETDANAEDPLLARIEHKGRLATLMAKTEKNNEYRFDIHLQGDDETIFFDM